MKINYNEPQKMLFDECVGDYFNPKILVLKVMKPCFITIKN